jgi:hypothetical protein
MRFSGREGVLSIIMTANEKSEGLLKKKSTSVSSSL